MLAAPRAKRQRERSLSPPLSTPDGTSASPIDQLVKRRRRGLGVHGDAHAHARSMSTSAAPMGLGTVPAPAPPIMSAPYAVYPATPEANSAPALYRSVSDPTDVSGTVYATTSMLQTPAPGYAAQTNQQDQAGGGRNRVKRVTSSGWMEEDQAAGGQTSSSPAFPAESAYARSNALLHELHLARLQPLPSPEHKPSPAPASSSPFHAGSSPSFFTRVHQQQSTTPAPTWAMRDATVPTPCASTPHTTPRYPYLSRQNSSETEFDGEASSDMDTEMDGESQEQAYGQTSGGRTIFGHSKGIQPATPQHAAYRPFDHRALNDPSTRRLGPSSSLSSPHSSQHTPRLDTSLSRSYGPRAPLGRAQSTGVQVTALTAEEAERTRRQYQEANELLGKLVLGRRSVTEAVVRRPGKL